MLPKCQEDEVLVGVGDFAYGHWTAYECGPAVDDFMLPNTSIPAPGTPLDFVLIGIMLVSAAIITWLQRGQRR